MKNYEFTIVLDGVNDHTPMLEDSLYEAGCDDTLINFKNGTVYLDFNRTAVSLHEAILSAIQQIEGMSLKATVISVAPDNLVSASDIARRLNLKKQAVSLWINGLRRKKSPFPHPVMKLSDPYPLWRWYEVVAWSVKNNIVKEQSLLDDAILIENINLVLEERRVPGKDFRLKLLEILNCPLSQAGEDEY